MQTRREVLNLTVSTGSLNKEGFMLYDPYTKNFINLDAFEMYSAEKSNFEKIIFFQLNLESL